MPFHFEGHYSAVVHGSSPLGPVTTVINCCLFFLQPVILSNSRSISLSSFPSCPDPYPPTLTLSLLLSLSLSLPLSRSIFFWASFVVEPIPVLYLNFGPNSIFSFKLNLCKRRERTANFALHMLKY